MPFIPESSDPSSDGARTQTDRQILDLKRRLIREATYAIGMLESAVDALFRLDGEAAHNVRGRDDRIDVEEVQIESECLRILALHNPYAHDFRVVTFILKTNASVERVGDHATSLAKIGQKIRRHMSGLPADQPLPDDRAVTVPPWPTALVEMGQRVPAMCHELLRAVLDEDAEGAKALVASDRVIDTLDKRLFSETAAMVEARTMPVPVGLLVSRAGRELERIGDLMTDVAEEVVYLVTGSIIRHEDKKRWKTGT